MKKVEAMLYQFLHSLCTVLQTLLTPAGFNKIEQNDQKKWGKTKVATMVGSLKRQFRIKTGCCWVLLPCNFPLERPNLQFL